MDIKAMSVSAANISSLGCGATVPVAFYPKDIDQLRQVQRRYAGHSRLFIAGGLTNTLVMSMSEDDAMIFCSAMRGIRVHDDCITVRAGEKTAHVADVARICGLSGMEDLCGIPGTVGGGVMGNAGCYDTAFADVIKSVRLFHLDDGQQEELSAEEIAFRYRYCNLRKNVDFITEVTLKLFPDSVAAIGARMSDVRKKRKQTLPTGKSLGSVLKKIDGVGCGYYLDQLGMKGRRIGGMQVSEKHAGIIVNRGDGTPEEYLALVELCESEIQKATGRKPEREVVIFGRNQ